MTFWNLLHLWRLQQPKDVSSSIAAQSNQKDSEEREDCGYSLVIIAMLNSKYSQDKELLYKKWNP